MLEMKGAEMNQWLKYHKDVLREEREAALAARTQKPAKAPARKTAGRAEPAPNPAPGH